MKKRKEGIILLFAVMSRKQQDQRASEIRRGRTSLKYILLSTYKRV
jgi:hypothetical protein